MKSIHTMNLFSIPSHTDIKYIPDLCEFVNESMNLSEHYKNK